MTNKFYEPLQQSIIEGNVPRMVLLIFTIALDLGASDIHIEPREKEVSVRFRVDGNFISYKLFDLGLRDSIVARIKIMSYLRIDEHRLPQD